MSMPKFTPEMFKEPGPQRSLFSPDEGLVDLCNSIIEGRTTIPIEEIPRTIDKLSMLVGPRIQNHYIAPIIREFFSQFFTNLDVESVLDPHAGLGGLLAIVQDVTGAKTAVAYEENEIARVLGQGLNPSSDWRVVDPLTESLDSGSFDAAVSVLPLGLYTRQSLVVPIESGEELNVERRLSYQLLVWAALHLKTNGVGVFVIDQAFLWSVQSPRHQFHNLGLGIAAAFALPSSASIQGEKTSLAIVVVRKRPVGKMFVADLPAIGAVEQVLANFRSSSEGSTLTEGVFIDSAEFVTFDSLRISLELTESEREFGWPSIHLTELAVSHVRGSSRQDFAFDDVDNVIYIPTVGISDVVNSVEEFTIKPQNYMQVVIDPTKSDARFVARFLNTELGRYIRESSMNGSTIRHFTKESLKSLRVLVPPVPIQERVLEVEDSITSERQRLLSLENDLTEMRRALWANPRSASRVSQQVDEFSQRIAEQVEEGWERWIETLPYPLASVLWAWFSSRPRDYDRRYRCLVHFFEAATEFIGSVLLSGFVSDLQFYERYREEFLRAVDERKLNRTDYGTWLQVATFFSKRLRTLLNSGAEERHICSVLFSDPTNRLQDMLASSDLMSVLGANNDLRNRWQGHTGLPSSREAEHRHSSLLEQLQVFREATSDGWANVELVLPLSCVPRRGVGTNEVWLLQGSRSDFPTVERRTTDCLDTESMHVLGKDARSSLQLLPFVCLGPNPPQPRTTCYFYSSIEDGAFRMISFQGADQSEWTESLETLSEAFKLVTEGIRARMDLPPS